MRLAGAGRDRDCGEAPATSGGTLCTGGDTGALHLAVQWLAGTLSPILVMKQDLTCILLKQNIQLGKCLSRLILIRKGSNLAEPPDRVERHKLCGGDHRSLGRIIQSCATACQVKLNITI